MKSALQQAFGEVNKNIPKIVKTKKTVAKRKMTVALSKARKMGAKIKPMSSTPSAYGNELPIAGSAA